MTPPIQLRRTMLTLTLVGASLALIAVALAPDSDDIGRAFAATRWRADGLDIALLAAQPAAVQIHIAAAVAALAIGGFVLARPKGGALHKTTGWTWVIAMAATALSSLFITGLNGDAYSLIHLLSGWTLVALPMGVYAIRRKNLRAHRAAMTGMFFGGLILAGALTFLPGRLLWRVFFG